MNNQTIEQWQERLHVSPYNRELDLQFSELAERGCVLRLPFRADLIGDPESGALHAGATAALVDTTFGFSVYIRIREHRAFVTLDLRIDHLHRSTPGRAILCLGECYKVTTDFAFIRGVVYHDDKTEPIATAVGVFMFTAGDLPMATGSSNT